MSSCQEQLRQASERLRQAGVEGPRRDALALLLATCGITRESLLRQPDQRLDPGQVARFQNAIERRMGREPVARILGQRQFWGLDFELSPAVLDPRPDSEILIEAALELTQDVAAPKVLDLGTGTGCLLLAYLHARKNAVGVGIDISPAAIAQAARNGKALGLAERAGFQVGNWTRGLDPDFNVVLCNPPYISAAEMPGLQPEVLNFDPHLALLGGENGLEAYRQILKGLKNIIISPAWVFFECGTGQSSELTEMLKNRGFLGINVRKDLAGHDRVVYGCLSAAAKKV